MIRVAIWNEFCHEAVQKRGDVLAHYPDGIHAYLASVLQDEFSVKTATLYNAQGERNENAGITPELLDETDVLIWWAHIAHEDVPDEAAKMVADAVRKGMGVIFLHSAHKSKAMSLLLGTSGSLHWREDGDSERLWVIDPAHPIVQGLGEYIWLPEEETYGEPISH